MRPHSLSHRSVQEVTATGAFSTSPGTCGSGLERQARVEQRLESRYPPPGRSITSVRESPPPLSRPMVSRKVSHLSSRPRCAFRYASTRRELLDGRSQAWRRHRPAGGTSPSKLAPNSRIKSMRRPNRTAWSGPAASQPGRPFRQGMHNRSLRAVETHDTPGDGYNTGISSSTRRHRSRAYFGFPQRIEVHRQVARIRAQNGMTSRRAPATALPLPHPTPTSLSIRSRLKHGRS